MNERIPSSTSDTTPNVWAENPWNLPYDLEHVNRVSAMEFPETEAKQPAKRSNKELTAPKWMSGDTSPIFTDRVVNDNSEKALLEEKLSRTTFEPESFRSTKIVRALGGCANAALNGLKAASYVPSFALASAFEKTSRVSNLGWQAVDTTASSLGLNPESPIREHAKIKADDADSSANEFKVQKKMLKNSFNHLRIPSKFSSKESMEKLANQHLVRARINFQSGDVSAARWHLDEVERIKKSLKK